jgi:carboxyl-terminal processing protease
MGLLQGDTIVAMDGCLVSTCSRSPKEALRFDDEIEISIERAETGSITLKANASRARAAPSSTVGRTLSGGVAYIRLYDLWNAGSPRSLPSLELLMQDLSAKDPSGWVLDLRSNPGGSFRVVELVAGAFGAEGLVYQSVLNNFPTSYDAEGVRQTNGTPIAILTDTGTGSAAEVLAESLRQLVGAVIVGEQTRGNVAGAERFRLSTGSLTVRTGSILVGPARMSFEGTGIMPDFVVPLTAEDLANGHDPQLDRAVAIVLAE